MNSTEAKAILSRELEDRYSPREAHRLAEWLLEEVLGHRALFEESISQEQYELAKSMSDRVAQGEPYQYVVGHVPFCGVDIKVAPGVLIPRPETEELVDLALDDISSGDRVVDWCTGSGCIALALAKNSSAAEVVGLDVSEEALSMARGNALHNGLDVKFIKADLAHPEIVLECAVIVCNPPYVLEEDKSSMSGVVLEHEPHMALFAPVGDPWFFFQKVLDFAADNLTPGGVIWFEGHEDLLASAYAELRRNGFSEPVVYKDLQGKNRFIRIQKDKR